ncbi:uncharacterized protein LOC115704575 [Cannabis sativa]|uniref:uncharacterized protein LOC115704575 n=1 Tax=Cannabis sativa TaxID=3483 RepID=UPI0029CA0B63|nr:uncharacterized protein LOC115704575 [Cannabis sativa]
MSILSWNCRGLGNPRALQFLKDIVIQKRPKFIFLCETLSKKDVLERLRVRLGFEGLLAVDVVGRSGGIALLWKIEEDVQVLGFSNSYIDVSIHNDNNLVWRLTGCYGEPNRNFRYKTWDLLRTLSTRHTLSWCIVGDLNNVCCIEDKRGGNPYPTWLIDGFNQALFDCNLRDLELTGYPFTWEKGRGADNWIEVRLDRALASQHWLDHYNSAKLFNIDVTSSDHTPLLLVPCSYDTAAPKRRFRFENCWLREPMCAQVIKDSWSSCPSDAITEKIAHCSNILQTWGDSYSGNFKDRIKHLKQEVQYWKKGRDALSVNKHKEAEQNLTNSISKLQNSAGYWVDWQSGLADAIKDYFTDLFNSSPHTADAITDSIPTTISTAQNMFLLAPVTEEEVSKAVKQMHPDKSPGPDGMTPGFYQRNWNVVGTDVIKLVRNFFLSGLLPAGLNHTNMVLIPKKKNPMTMGDLRPISLCNVLYKIISKVVANRLKEVLPQLISEYQSAFIPGHLISDNIMISYEVMHYLKRKRHGKEGFMALKLDFSKAYDRVEWSFIEAMMKKMGFHDHFVQLILQCVSTVQYTILNSGKEVGPITPHRGIRQGDPLSSYLFLICAEGFSSIIKRFESSRLLRGCRVANGAPVISHMLFADDSYVYCRANDREVSNVLNMLQTFQLASGQEVNFAKSSVFFSSNTTRTTRDRVCQQLNIAEADEDSFYLGLPCLEGRNKNAILGFLKDKMQKRVQQWESRFLSKGGKEVLLKTVAQALPSYAMSVFLLPIETCKSMESIMSKFWWKSSSQSQGVTWASWNRLSKHKNEGGLGFRDLRDYNLAMLGKQAWRLITNDASIVSKVYKARYYPHASFFSASLGNNPSFIWKSLFETKSLIEAGAVIHIGNGLKTSITSDPWLLDLHNHRVISTHPAIINQKVASLMCIDEPKWDPEILDDLFEERDKALILGIPLSHVERDDCWSWMLERTGIYSVKSAYRFLQQSKNTTQSDSDFWKVYWKIQIPPKVLHFSWKAITGCLPTKIQLQTKHVPVDSTCPLCNNAAETIIHVLVYCPFAISCWNRSSISSCTSNFADFGTWFEEKKARHNDNIQKEILMIAWAIWNARNKLLWNRKTMIAAEDAEVEHWISPAHDTIKVNNVDGAIFEASNAFGFGFIARSCDGKLIEGVSTYKIGRVAPEIAEVTGIKEALSWIKDKGWQKVSLETDCLVAVQALHSSASLPSAFGLLILDCQQLLAKLHNVKIYFVKRSANRATHFLARSSCFSSVRVFYDYNSPSELVEIVKNNYPY